VNDTWETLSKASTPSAMLIEGPMLAHQAEDEGMAAAEVVAGQAWSRETMRDPRRDLHPPRMWPMSVQPKEH